MLNTLATWRDYPHYLWLDNRPELISQKPEDWAEDHGVLLDFIQPVKLAPNAYIERFNRTYREEVMDLYLFDNPVEARTITKEWLEECNVIRPHEELGGLSPYEYVTR